jgi:hypothetical protein
MCDRNPKDIENSEIESKKMCDCENQTNKVEEGEINMTNTKTIKNNAVTKDWQKLKYQNQDSGNMIMNIKKFLDYLDNEHPVSDETNAISGTESDVVLVGSEILSRVKEKDIK